MKLLLVSDVSLQGDDIIIAHVDLNLSDKLDLNPESKSYRGKEVRKVIM